MTSKRPARGRGQRRPADAMADEIAAMKAVVLVRRAPLTSARKFIEARIDRPLLHHAGNFYEWQGTHYRELGDGDVEAMLYAYLDKCKRKERDKIVPFDPERADVDKISHALKAEVHTDSQITPPTWRHGTGDGPLLACANGLLRLEDGKLLPHSADFFNTSAVEFAHDPRAGEPETWLAFLKSLWDDDVGSIATLQQMFGYIISGQQEHQKMFLLVGPPRSGKGTIGRVLTKLVGAGGHVGLTLASLAKNFGLAPLINKGLVIVPDARLRGASHEIVERLLAISGGDTLTVDRKHRDAWTGRLPGRFVFLTNEIPALADNSGAIASRFVILEFRNSFLGKEDLDLERNLLKELPAILNWAVDGWRHLRNLGRFSQPEKAGASVRLLGSLASPVKAFITDRCEVGPEFTVAKKLLFQAWGAWCNENGREHPGNEATLGRDLHAAYPNIDTTRQQEDGERERLYTGIRLREQASPKLPPALDEMEKAVWGDELPEERPAPHPSATPPAPTSLGSGSSPSTPRKSKKLTSSSCASTATPRSLPWRQQCDRSAPPRRWLTPRLSSCSTARSMPTSRRSSCASRRRRCSPPRPLSASSSMAAAGQ